MMINKKTIGSVILCFGAGMMTAFATWLQAQQAADDCYEEFSNEIKLNAMQGIVSDLKEIEDQNDTDE